MAKKLTATDRLKALIEGKKPDKPKIHESILGKAPAETKIDKRHFNKRTPGTGQQPGGTAEHKRINKQLLAQHFGEEVPVRLIDAKTGKEVVKMKPRVIVQIERLFQASQHKDGTFDPNAIDKWLNRALGKAPQPLVGDEDEDAIQVDLGAERILRKLYGDKGN